MSILKQPSPIERTIPHPSLPWLAALAFFMQALDTTILNTALPSMATDLHRSPLAMQSTIISYALTVALFIPISGWLADRFGTRKVFIFSVALFSLGSLFCALSTHLGVLVSMRVLQGIGGAMMMPVARLALIRSYPRSSFLGVMSLVTMPALIGPVLGPVLGGWLVTVASWHWIFLINIPIGLVGIWAAKSIMPDLTAPQSPFDWIGFFLFSLGLVALSLALDLSGEALNAYLNVWVIATLGILLLSAYVWHAQRSSGPLFDLTLFKSRTFNAGIFGNVCCRLGTGGIALLLPLMLQVAFGYSANLSGWMLAPLALAALSVKPLVKRLLPSLGYRRMLLGLTVLSVFTLLSFALFTPHTPLGLMLIPIMLFGALNSMQLTSMNTLAVSDLAAEHMSMGNSLLSVSQQLSISFGIAVSSSALHWFNPSAIKVGPELTTVFSHTFCLLAALTLLSSLIFMQLKPNDGAVMHNSEDRRQETEDRSDNHAKA